jgi:hypothetical protein
MGFEAASSDGVHRSIGISDETVIKLSLCLSLTPYLMREAITSMGVSKSGIRNGLSMTVSSNISYFGPD